MNRVFLCVLSLWCMTGCKAWRGFVDSFGQPPVLAPVTFSVLCDPSAGAPCSLANLSATLDGVLPVFAERPRSEIRLYVLGEDASRLRLLGTVVSTASPRPSSRARREHQECVKRLSRDTLVHAAEEVLPGLSVTRSPLAESITRIAMSDTVAASDHVLIAITDGKECAPGLCLERRAPTSAVFASYLEARGALVPGSLRGVHLILSYLALTPNEGGRAPTLTDYVAIRELWSEAAPRADVAKLTILTGPVTPEVLRGGCS